MARQITMTVYTFEELDDKAKAKARAWAHEIPDLFGSVSDWRASMQAFAGHFGVTLRDWSVGPWSRTDCKHDAENRHFRGLKLKTLDRDHMPTGYCGDCDFWQPFFDEFKRTGNALYAFNFAIHAGLIAWREDWESAYEDEQLDEFLTINQYEFTKDGKRA